jgi:hypothetical protein
VINVTCHRPPPFQRHQPQIDLVGKTADELKRVQSLLAKLPLSSTDRTKLAPADVIIVQVRHVHVRV